MRIAGVVLAITLSLAALGLVFDSGSIPKKVVKKFHNNTYVITDAINADNRNGLGTGVWLDERYLLTNCHVAQTFEHLSEENGEAVIEYLGIKAVSWDERKVFAMDVVACDMDRDLALLKSHWPNHDAIKVDVDWRTPPFGTEVYSAGYGLNQPLSPKIGYTGKVRLYKTGHRIGITMPIVSGDSGSPVFNKWGKLVGLVSAVYATRTFSGFVIPIANISIAVPGISIGTFLEEHYETDV